MHFRSSGILITVAFLSMAAAQPSERSAHPPPVIPDRRPDVLDPVREPGPPGPPVAPPPIRRVCPSSPAPSRVEIHRIDAPVGSPEHRQKLDEFVAAVGRANATVLLGPDVVLDFSKAPDLVPVFLASCVTLKSVDSFRRGPVVSDGEGMAAPLPRERARNAASLAGSPVGDVFEPSGSARTPHSLGPLLRFGTHPQSEVAFLMIECRDAEPDHVRDITNDHVTISGLRIEGPSLGQQTVDQFGIYIIRCLNIEISNNEIFGWGGAGVRVLDDWGGQEGPGQAPITNYPGDRIGNPRQVRILRNYFHHNQHASENESVDCDFSWDWGGLSWVGCELFRQHAGGYGVDVHDGAWALIDSNLFDMNRHAIAAAGAMGGYDARRNLVLKGGGYHGRTFHTYTHQLDIHGTGDNGMGGKAGVQSWFFENSVQFRNAPAIKIRGRPALRVYIGDNIFTHEGLENDAGDDAVHLLDRNDLDVIELLPNNVIDYDSYGRYGVCDFDGDGIDDLFLATGKTWWFSSFGEFPWSFLAARKERFEDVRLGYFDDDKRCDVLAQSGPDWVISSGGTKDWRRLGAFNSSLNNVAFGRFDPNVRDSRAGVTRKTTHAFRRLSSGQWQITRLSSPAWENVQSSSYPFAKLRFGDFTGDGVTDVLALSNGRWAISDAARGSWTRLNAFLSDDVGSLLVADLDNNNVDDLLKVSLTGRSLGSGRVRLSYKWYVSDDGRGQWRELRSYTFDQDAFQPILSGRAFAGRFGEAPGGGVLLTDGDRLGHFYAPLEANFGRSPDWQSLFQY